MQELTFNVLNIVADLVGILLNGKVVISFAKQIRGSNFIAKGFSLNLMVSNLILCLTSLIMTLLVFLEVVNEFLLYNLSFILITSVAVEASLLLITADRFIAVQFALRYSRIITKNVVIWCISLKWLLIVTSVISVGLSTPHSTSHIQLETVVKGMWISMVIVTIFGVFTLSFVNSFIFHEVRRQTNILLSVTVNSFQHSSEKAVSTQLLRDQQKRSAILCFAMVICFIICWLPTVVFSCIALKNDQSDVIDDVVWYASRLFISVNMIINPCLYGLIRKGKCKCM